MEFFYWYIYGETFIKLANTCVSSGITEQFYTYFFHYYIYYYFISVIITLLQRKKSIARLLLVLRRCGCLTSGATFERGEVTSSFSLSSFSFVSAPCIALWVSWILSTLPWRRSTAWGSTFATKCRHSVAALLLPGRLMMIVLLRIPHTGL